METFEEVSRRHVREVKTQSDYNRNGSIVQDD